MSSGNVKLVSATYKYHHIQTDEIRLLHLKAGSPGQPLSGRLVQTTVEEPLPYKALSYEWGTPEGLVAVDLEDGCIHIRPNLAAALKAIRRPEKELVIWVDMLCIDQGNTLERNAQVALMHKIYSKAEEVLLWMGEEDVFTHLAFDTARKVALAVQVEGEGTETFDQEKIEKGAAAAEEELNKATALPLPPTNENDEFLSVLERSKLFLEEEVEQQCLDNVLISSLEKGHQRIEATQILKLLGGLDAPYTLQFVLHRVRKDMLRQPMPSGSVRWSAAHMPPRTKAFVDQLELSAPMDIAWAALCTVFSRPWFYRVWMMQEVVLAQKPTIVIGSLRLPWDHLMLTDTVFYKLGMFTSRNNRASHHAVQMSICRDQRKREEELLITDLMLLGRASDCSVAHDRVYAFLGLCDPKHLKNLEIDYDSDVAKLYAKTVAYWISESRTLDILEHANPIRSPDLPSWVPDLRIPSGGGEFHAWARTENMESKRKNARAQFEASSEEANIHFDPSEQAIHLRGKLVDRVKKTSVKMQHSQYNKGRATKPVVNPAQQIRLYEAVLMVFDAWQALFLSYCTDFYPNADDHFTAYFMTLIWGMHIGTMPLGPMHEVDAFIQISVQQRNLPEQFHFAPSTVVSMMMGMRPQKVDWNGMPSFWQYAGSMCAYKRFFVTQNGLIGVGPTALKEGDMIYKFEGGLFPFIVRKRPDGKNILIGITYVHGLMRDEKLVFFGDEADKVKEMETETVVIH